jgi:hypothetical protein
MKIRFNLECSFFNSSFIILHSYLLFALRASALPFLFREPSVGFQEFDADALFAVSFVHPDAVDFGFEAAPEGGRQAYVCAHAEGRVCDESRAAATNFDGCGLSVEWLAVLFDAVQFDREVHGDARASGALRASAFYLS